MLFGCVFGERAHPGRDEGGFAKASRRRDQGELLREPLVEQIRQPRAGDERMRRSRHEELGRYEGRLPRRPFLVALHRGGGAR